MAIDPKTEAHRLVAQAIRAGELHRPHACENCGLDIHKPLAAHHADYSRPLDVEWLCYPCHGLVHATARRGSPPWPRGVVPPPNVLTVLDAARRYGVSPQLVVVCHYRGLLRRRTYRRRDVVTVEDMERVFANSRYARSREK